MAVSISHSGLPFEKREEIIKELTLNAKGAKSSGYGPRVATMTAYDIQDDKFILPLMWSRKKFNLKGMRKAHDVRYERLPVKWREGQGEVFDEAIGYLREEGSVFLQLHCGYGKTFLSLQLIAALGVRTMILVHRTFLGEQFLTEAENVIPGQLTFIKDNDVEFDPDKKAYICTDQRALKLPEEFIKTIDLIVIDEAKYWCTPSRLEALLKFRPIYTMGLCAERKRKDGFDLLLDMFFGKNIFRKSIKPFTVWNYHTDFQPTIERPKYGPARINWSLAMKSIAEMTERNEMIRDICRLRARNKIMILVSFIYHIDALYGLLKEAGEDVDTFCGNKTSFKNCRILIATYSKAEMGFDDKNLCEDFDGERINLLILGSFYKKEIEQSAGRVMRTDAPEIISIVDDMPTLKKHSKTHNKWFKSRNGTVMDPEFLFDIKRKHPIAEN